MKKIKHIINIKPILIYLCLIVLFILTAQFPQDQLMKIIPGYPSDYKSRAFSGYLNTNSSLRKLHYVFLQSATGESNNDTIILWINGGPGCSSKVGFLQQIAPYYLPLGASYKQGDNLQQNKYSWQKLANLLFIDFPAGVGFSNNQDTSFIYNDQNTKKDSLAALVNFFYQKFPQYNKNNFTIIGQQYAGKYASDLALTISNNNFLNPNNKINLKGIMIGNPYISKQSSSEESKVEFMISHNFVDPKLNDKWFKSCKNDFESAGCSYFKTRYNDLVANINPKNVYRQCNKIPQLQNQYAFDYERNFYLKQCSENNQGVKDYFNINYQAFKSIVKTFQICNQQIASKYQKSVQGSKNQFQSLIQSNNIRVWFYSGDLSGVLSFDDTQRNLEDLGLKQQSLSEPWIINFQHVGFIRKFSSKVNFYIIKGAGLQVLIFKRQPGFELIQKFLKQI